MNGLMGVDVEPLIVTEVVRRLKTIPLKGDVNIGIPGQDLDTYPCIWVYVDDESPKYVKYGVYNISLPIYIEYYKKGIKKNDVYHFATAMKAELKTALETDERMTITYNKILQDLVSKYYRVATNYIYYVEPHAVVGVSMTYMFEFVDTFKGLERRRTI